MTHFSHLMSTVLLRLALDKEVGENLTSFLIACDLWFRLFIAYLMGGCRAYRLVSKCQKG